MNFARTNLSLLLARQNRQSAVLQRAGLQRDGAASRLGGRVAMPAAAAATIPAASPASQSQTLELVGAIAMMAAFLVLALFG
jgi:hypothetical protein